MRLHWTIAALAAAAAASACTSVSSNYTGEITQPNAKSIIVCHGFDCRNKTRLVLTDADERYFASALAAGHSSPAAERAAIAKAVAYYEKRSVTAIGAADKAKSDISQTGKLGQMDCIDESTNTRSLLLHLAHMGLLKHHDVLSNISRGIMVDGRYPHSTAVLKEKSVGKKWAVDSWFGASGEQPDVMPLDVWVSHGVFGAR